MTTTPGLQATLLRYQHEIQQALRQAVQRGAGPQPCIQAADLSPFYGQMQYHMGWVDRDFAPIPLNPGKLLRPTLLLLAYEAGGAWGLTGQTQDHSIYLRRALPAAAAVELTHNFTLIHDDIVDNDSERHHQPTLWTIWGRSQGINTGDGMFALARLALWDILAQGVEGSIAAHLAAVLDRTCLTIAEGQFLDLSFESRTDVSVTMYMEMIARKTAALMSCACEMGAMLGTRESATIESLRAFGREIGLAFQVRDDMLGIWASSVELGKTSAGDIYRRKQSLPILHALEHASSQDQQTLRQIYTRQLPPTEDQVETALCIFARTGTRNYCQTFLSQQCWRARQALNAVPHLANAVAVRALEDMATLVHFVETTMRA
ncbi:MAG TPA: polyprenyl synthetase family protein [Ktedonobacteraceae bacterium]|jgi:geranylgeranyl diphosphate synthase type I